MLTGDEHYGGSMWINFTASNSYFLSVKSPRCIVVGSATFGGPYYLYLPSTFGLPGSGGPMYTIINETGSSINVRFRGQNVGVVFGISAFRAGVVWKVSNGADGGAWRGKQYTKTTGAA